MQSMTQIAHELGYKNGDCLRMKLRRNGVDLQSIPHQLGDDGCTHFYDHEAVGYIKRTAGVCHRFLKEIPAKRLVVDMMDHAEAQPQTVTNSTIPMQLPDMKSLNLDQRLQQIKVLGDLLSQQIEALNRDMSAVSRSMAS